MMLDRAIVLRFAMVTGPRAAVVMCGVGGVAGFGSQIVDLTGQLPEHATKEYATRKASTVEGVVWHHSASSSQSIKSIADYHVQANKWPAIAYHYAIGSDGRVYKLHATTTVSYHAAGYNKRTIGVVLLGNYHTTEVPPAMEASALALQEFLKDEYKLVYAWMHKETKATACPGKYAEEFLKPTLYGKRP